MPFGPWQLPQNCLLCTAKPPSGLGSGSEATTASNASGVSAGASGFAAGEATAITGKAAIINMQSFTAFILYP